MRKLRRPDIDDSTSGNPTAAKYLSKKQREINENPSWGSDVIRSKWEAARATKTMESVATLLGCMVGPRGRCMYCEDSRSTDIEHFWPLVDYRDKVFQWTNHLWICTGCNRKKSSNFAVDKDGLPLLIDPSVDDPWKHLIYDSTSAMISPRFDANTNTFDPKGAHTADPETLPINIESVLEGRRRQRRNLARAVSACIRDLREGKEVRAAVADLEAACRDNDAFGMLDWYFCRDGKTEEPFASLQTLLGSEYDELGKRLVG